MKSFFKNLRNLIPYLLLTGIYFFFINIEARNDRFRYHNGIKSKEKLKESNDFKLEKTKSKERIAIPVIPYSK